MSGLASASMSIAAGISMSLDAYAAAKTPIENPKAFISDVYRQIANSEESRSPYSPPENIYSPSTAIVCKLQEEDRRTGRLPGF
jgi:hypothetical protein